MTGFDGHTALRLALIIAFATAAAIVAALWWFGEVAEEQKVSHDYLDDYSARLHQFDRELQHTRRQQAEDQVSINAAHNAARVLLHKADCAWKNAADHTTNTRRTDGAILRLINGTPTPDQRDAFERATDAKHPCIDTDGDTA